eukprot:SAG11_NODE_603_length_8247_cov_13.668385_3_plen_342_part_00
MPSPPLRHTAHRARQLLVVGATLYPGSANTMAPTTGGCCPLQKVAPAWTAVKRSHFSVRPPGEADGVARDPKVRCAWLVAVAGDTPTAAPIAHANTVVVFKDDLVREAPPVDFRAVVDLITGDLTVVGAAALRVEFLKFGVEEARDNLKVLGASEADQNAQVEKAPGGDSRAARDVLRLEPRHGVGLQPDVSQKRAVPRHADHASVRFARSKVAGHVPGKILHSPAPTGPAQIVLRRRGLVELAEVYCGQVTCLAPDHNFVGHDQTCVRPGIDNVAPARQIYNAAPPMLAGRLESRLKSGGGRVVLALVLVEAARETTRAEIQHVEYLATWVTSPSRRRVG